MDAIQRLVIELDHLSTRAPPGGYAPLSTESIKIAQIREKIAQLSEGRAVRPAQPPLSPSASQEKRRVSQDPEQSGTQVPRGTLHERLVEIQQLLAEMDGLKNEDGNSVEVQNRIKAIKERVAGLMDEEGPERISDEPSTSQRG